MRNLVISALGFGSLFLTQCGALAAQETPPASKSALHVIGSLTATDPAASTITVKADKTGQDYNFTLANTRTLLKVPPGAKDLKSAVRITSQDLQISDRVDVRYSAEDAGANPIPARSVLLMSARDLAQAHAAEQQAWQNAIVGTVTNVEPANQAIFVRIRSAGGSKAITVQTTPATAFTRYSPENPASPEKSSITDIEPGDQVRIVGEMQGDNLEAQKIYSGAFRTIPATIVSIDPDNNGLSVKDLQTKQTVHVTVTPETMIRKLPTMVAMMIAHRVNGSQAGAAGQQGARGATGTAPSQRQMEGGQSEEGPAGGGHMNGDPAKILERMPPAAISDLKPGDAVVLSVAKGKDPSHFVASAVVAGVEPIFQSTPPKQGQSFGGGDWGLDMNIPAQ